MFVFRKTTRFSFQTVLNLYNYKKHFYKTLFSFQSSNTGRRTSSRGSPSTGDRLGARPPPGQGDEAALAAAERDGRRVRGKENSNEPHSGRTGQ